MLDSFLVKNSVPEEEKVDGAVQNPQLNRSLGPSVMTEDYLWACLRADNREESLDPSKW